MKHPENLFLRGKFKFSSKTFNQLSLVNKFNSELNRAEQHREILENIQEFVKPSKLALPELIDEINDFLNNHHEYLTNGIKPQIIPKTLKSEALVKVILFNVFKGSQLKFKRSIFRATRDLDAFYELTRISPGKNLALNILAWSPKSAKDRLLEFNSIPDYS